MTAKTVIGMPALIFMSLFLSGSATIISGTTQKIMVTSAPSDATAKADNTITMKTPATFTLERKSDHTVEVSKEGYKTASVMIQRTFNGAAAGNLLLGGIIGGGVDMASGASSKLVPERIDLVLEPGTGASITPKFASEKDAEYYEKNILKTGAQKDVSSKSSQAMQDKSLAQTNFSPKTAVT